MRSVRASFDLGLEELEFGWKRRVLRSVTDPAQNFRYRSNP